MCVHRHSVADLPSEQIVNGHVGPFAFYVPQRHVECAENIVLNGAVAPISSNVGTLPQVLNTVGRFADPERSILLFDGRDNSRSLIDVACRTDTVEPGFRGHDFQEDPRMISGCTCRNPPYICYLQLWQAAGGTSVTLRGQQKTGLHKIAA